MCEDRGIEGEGVLREAFSGTTAELAAFFDYLHRHYNTGLFGPIDDPLDPLRLVDTAILQEIVDHLYTPYSPFSFSVLDADFLGLVYESTLSEYLTINSAQATHTVELNPKKEYEKRDVVTTPQELVEATIRSSFDVLDVENPKVLDFAVGSGRFLVAAFQKLIEDEIEKREGTPGKPGLSKVADGVYKLNFLEKRRILEEQCFGIDTDFNAVEVASFSLLIKLLEDETASTLPRAKTALLPDLKRNVIHGNTLVRELPAEAPHDVTELTQPIDLQWAGLPERLDLIIGNPPYMNTEEMKSYNEWERQYLIKHYRSSHQQFDKYFAFIEFAIENLSPQGVLGTIVPNKWMTIQAGTKLRSMLRTEVSVRTLLNFRHAQLFEGKTIYVCLLVASKDTVSELFYAEPSTTKYLESKILGGLTLKRDSLPPDLQGPWVLPANDTEKTVLTQIFSNSTPMGEIVSPRNGVQTSANAIMLIPQYQDRGDTITFIKKGVEWTIEKAVTKPYLNDSKAVRSHREIKADSRIIFPYRDAKTTRAVSGYEVIPENEMESQYPLAYKYLEANREALAKRNVSKGERAKAFYIYGRTQAIGYCTDAPKIFYSTNQRGEKYGLDLDGIVYQSGGTAGEIALFPTGTQYSLDYILAVLDQTVIEFYIRKRGSSFRGGYVARGTAVITDVPVPRLDFDDQDDVRFHRKISENMTRLRRLHADLETVSPRNSTQLEARISKLKEEIRSWFIDRWDIDPSDVNKLAI